jgi:hypothetical protein
MKMAKIAELDTDGWEEWISTRPPVVQELCRRLPPDRLYRMKPHGQRVTIVSYAENGTVKVNVGGEFNAVTFERQVFGVNPDDLEECDLPAANEPVGALFSEREAIESHIEMLRDSMGMKGSNTPYRNATQNATPITTPDAPVKPRLLDQVHSAI